MYTRIYEQLKEAFPQMSMRLDEPMSKHTSFKIGGPAKLMVMPGSPTELQAVVRTVMEHDVRSIVMGSGTNILAPDEGVDAVIIKTTPGMDLVEVMGNTIIAGPGAALSKVAAAAQKNGLTGLEFAHGIPGSVGGAVSMNAGAYGGQMEDVVVDVEYVNRDGEIQVLQKQQLDFGYRHSAFSERIGIICGVRMKLKEGDKDEIRAKMQELAKRRRESQPLDLPSAGSVFKRPEGGYAAQLIDEAGFKGFTVGGAQVSPKHAGFIVNIGGAKASDVLKIIDYVQRKVEERTGIELEPEVRIL